MPQVTHQRTFEKQLTSDSYVIAKVCAKEGCELKEIDPHWNVCPFCGEKIELVEQQDITVEK